MSQDHTDQHFDALRSQVIAWFRANGVDTSRLPQDPHASITNGQLTFRRWVLSEPTGTPMIDPDDRNRLLTETVTVPLVVPPPPDVETWLAPTCPTCGR
jgi:hypothetical protein